MSDRLLRSILSLRSWRTYSKASCIRRLAFIVDLVNVFSLLRMENIFLSASFWISLRYSHLLLLLTLFLRAPVSGSCILPWCPVQCLLNFWTNKLIDWLKITASLWHSIQGLYDMDVSILCAHKGRSERRRRYVIVTQTRQKHALYTLIVGGQNVFFDPQLKKLGVNWPADSVFPRSTRASHSISWCKGKKIAHLRYAHWTRRRPCISCCWRPKRLVQRSVFHVYIGQIIINSTVIDVFVVENQQFYRRHI